jgi:hypothetical protein
MGALETMLGCLRRCLDGFPDKRRGLNTRYSMGDIGMAAFSVFFMQSPSFLAHQRRFEDGHGRSNGWSLFGIPKLPSDNHIRDMLDAASPALLHPVFAEAVDLLASTPGGLDDFRRLGRHVLIALDGTEYHCSKTIHCAHCSTRLRGKGGETEYFHSMLGATIVAPGHDKVIPLQPEFIRPQDGHGKQDCETAAAKRWLDAHSGSYAKLSPIYLGDDLFSRQPLCEVVLQAGGHFLFVCKPSSHLLIEEYKAGVELATLDESVKRGKQRLTYRYTWLCDAPLRDSKDALKVNWLQIEIINAKGETTYRNSFITDLDVNKDTVVDLAACGRARWKIENETFNVLKNNGYNLEHNFGHGRENLATILVALNLIAFAFHTIADIADQLWSAARQKLGPRYNFFAKLSALTDYCIFASWGDLLLTLAFAKPPPLPP